MRYQVDVIRDDRWWMIRVPGLDGYKRPDGSVNIGDLTQARRFADIEREAVGFICTVTDSAPSAVEIDVTVRVGGIDITAESDEIRRERAEAARLSADVQAKSRSLAHRLSESGVAVRDIGEVLGVSFQRAGQLIGG